MDNKISHYFICIFGLLFFIFAGFFSYVNIVNSNPRNDKNGSHWAYVTILPNVHLAITKFYGGDIVIFNQSSPYMGSIIEFDGIKPKTQEIGCDFYGFYFRSIRHIHGQGGNIWTIMISFWYPMIFFGVSFILFLFIRKKAGKIT